MHRGDGILELDAVLPGHGNPVVYNYMNIPAADDTGWETPPFDENGSIFLSETSALAGKPCLGWADFTYFQTEVTIPDGAEISQFEVTFQEVEMVPAPTFLTQAIQMANLSKAVTLS